MPVTVHVGFNRNGPRASEPMFLFPNAGSRGPEVDQTHRGLRGALGDGCRQEHGATHPVGRV